MRLFRTQMKSMGSVKTVIIFTVLFMEIISEELVPLEQNEWYKYLSPQTDKGLSNVVFSGPVIALDSETLFVTNIRTDSNYTSDLQFFVAIGSEKEFIEEVNSTSTFRFYKNENIYLTVPNKWTTGAINEFGVWSNTTETVVTSIILNFSANKIPLKQTDNMKRILRVPKCCKFEEELVTGGCQMGNSSFAPNFTVFMNNETHLDDNPNNTVPYLFVPYFHYPQCNKTKIGYYNTDNVHFLINTSVIVNIEKLKGILTHDDFCLEEDIVIICMDLQSRAEMRMVFIILTIISTVCYAFTAVWYWFVLHVKDIHKQCFIGYSSFMCITFLLLTIVQYIDSGCNIIGGFFFFFVMGSYLWLLVLCIDLQYIICHHDKNKKSLKRLSIYIISTVSMAALLTIVSVYDGIADVPNSFIRMESSCDYSGSNINLFFIPLLIIIISCMVLLILVRYKIYYFDKEHSNHYFWIESKTNFKFIFRSYLIFWIIKLLWIIRSYVNTLAPSYMIEVFKILELLQGIITMAIFIFSKHGYRQTKQAINRKKRAKPKYCPEELKSLQ